jgi:hypothetical protein
MDVTELRVHGVSGTPPEVLVGSPAVEQVAGDDLVRFVRPSPAPPHVPGRPAVEGMSWGRLTSGPAVQALWLLLLPLGLVNLAFWAGARPHLERFQGLVRLLALSVTAVLTVSVTHLAVDLVAWQCRSQDCGTVAGVLAFADGWEPGRRVVLAALVPVLSLVALAFVARRASLRYESVHGDAATADATADPVRHPGLDSAWMWRGEALGRRLRAVHLATGWSVVAAAVALVPDGRSGLAVIALVLGGAVVVASALLVAVPTWWTCWSGGARPGERAIGAALQAASLVALALAAAGAWTHEWTGGTGGTLPRLPLLVDLLVVGQTALVLLLLAVRLLERHPDGGVLGRVGPALLASTGVLLGYAYSAAASARVADLLRGSEGRVDLVSLRIFDWGAAGFVVFAVILVVTGLSLAARVAAGRRRLVTEVLREYGYTVEKLTDEEYRRWRSDHRVRRVAGPRATSELAQVSNVLAFLAAGGAAGLAVAVLASASTAANLVGADVEVVPPQALVATGGWLVTLAGAGLVALAVAGWRSPEWRRRLGIAWDVLAFWPRAAHPFAPPSYCERAVPQLVARTRYLARDGRSTHAVVLSGHSQGSVICAAVVQQLVAVDPRDGLDRVALLTHGSPLGRAYEVVFPHHFGRERLKQLDERLHRRWVNLYRSSDPIGSSLQRVLRRRDLLVSDPEGLEMDDARAAYPPVRGHSGYDLTAAYEEAVEDLAAQAAGRALRVPVPPQGAPSLGA